MSALERRESKPQEVSEEIQASVVEIAELAQKVTRLVEALRICQKTFARHGLEVHAGGVKEFLIKIGAA
jgi:prefoldin subunit 5